MDKKYINENEVIERYLLGKLSDDERQKFRVALLFDKELQQEVEDTRLLHQHIQLLKTKKYTNKKSPFKGWIIGILFLICIGVVFYFINKNKINQQKNTPVVIENSQKNIDPIIKEKINPTTDDLLNQEEEKEVKKELIIEPFIPKKKEIKTKVSPPIAEAKTEENLYLEQFIDGNFRNNEVKIEVRSPKIEETLLLKNGQINLNIKGIVALDKMPEKNQFFIRLFSNKKADFDDFKPLLSANPTINESENKYELSFNALISLPKGSYYFIIEDNEIEDMIYVGKFLVK